MTGHPLITGATGFAGGHLLDALRRDEACVHGWFNPGGRTPDRADAAVEWTPVDLLDPAAVHRSLATIRPSAIYHCAGLADVHASWKSPTRALRINVLGTHHLLRAAKELGLSCPILVIGSALVYQPSSEPLNEAHPLNPTSPYGISKLAQEMLGRASPLRILLARPFNHAGPRQDAHYATSAFARQLVESKMDGETPSCGSATSNRGVTSRMCATRCWPIVRSSRAGRRTGRTTCAPVERTA